MKLVMVLISTLLLCISCFGQQITDSHQHLLGPGAAATLSGQKPFSAVDLIPLLDAAGIRRAVVLSVAYMFGNPNKPPVADEYAKVQAENDWTGQQVLLYPDRLRAFCAVDPLKEYALAEIARCAKDPVLRSGLKLHLGNSDVDLDTPEHVAKLRIVFASAEAHRMPVVVHLHACISCNRPYGAAEATHFLNEVLPAAPTIPIQIAHLAGAGAFDPPTDAALGVFIGALRRQDPRMRHVYFDVTTVAGVGDWQMHAAEIAQRIRQIGVERVLYGSDGAFGGVPPAHYLAAFRSLPLTIQEKKTVENNSLPGVF